jgi:hypothetical protein
MSQTRGDLFRVYVKSTYEGRDLEKLLANAKKFFRLSPFIIVNLNNKEIVHQSNPPTETPKKKRKPKAKILEQIEMFSVEAT